MNKRYVSINLRALNHLVRAQKDIVVLSNWHLANVEQKSDLLHKSHQCMNVQEQIHGLLDIYLCLIFTVPKKCSWRGVLDTTLCDKMFMAIYLINHVFVLVHSYIDVTYVVNQISAQHSQDAS
jgi:hypothetical protein